MPSTVHPPIVSSRPGAGRAPRARRAALPAWGLWAPALGTLLAACTGQIDAGPGRYGAGTEFAPAPAALHRLTRAEHLASLDVLFPAEAGFTLPDGEGELPADDDSNGFSTISGSLLSISPSEVEAYERAAEAMMRQAIDPARREAFFGCDVATGERCVRAFLARFGRLAWRRALTDDELDQLAEIATTTGGALGDPWAGAGYAISALLQSPHFLFRVEVGEPDPEEPARLRYTSLEMASRLSFLVWGGPPDEELLAAGEAGRLVDEGEIAEQVARMLEDPRATAALERFLGEFFSLDRLALAQKDPVLFPEWSPELRDSMHAEIVGLFDEVIENDVDVRTLLSTDVTYVDSRMAGLYGLPDPGAGALLRTRLPRTERRGGILGRPAILAMWSHASVTSPSRLGKFVLTSIRCEGIDDPPPGQSLEIPTSEEPMTLRERLETLHQANPSCNACHARLDPMGFPFEGFDPMGRSRSTDNGLPVDTEVELDGVTIEDAAALGAYLAESRSVGRCIGRRFQRYATGHRESIAERVGMAEVERAFDAGGFRLEDLVTLVALSPVFRTAAPPLGDCVAGASEACPTACGEGARTCLSNGTWGACRGPGAAEESCNGRDDDCDGTTDEALARTCSSACGEGAETCSAGSWGTCSARTPLAEGCNHVDDDCDGTTDEGFGPNTHVVPFSTLASFEAPCDGSTERFGTYCTIAFHEFCSMGDGRCGTSGFGPVESGAAEGHAVCVNATVLDTSWEELGGFLDACSSGLGYSPPCNAAIHRLCAARGLTTGFGPVRIAGGVSVACVPGAEVIGTTYTELSGFHGGCTAGSRMGPDCNAAMGRFCQARGFVSGFGPLENSGDIAVVGCVR